MILLGIVAEGGAGVSLSRLVPELELGFGGPLAGAGVLGPDFSLPVHYLHGVVLGLLFAGIILLGEHFRVAPRVPLWSSGLVFGAVVSGIVLVLLAVTTSVALSPGLIGLVSLLHLTFGGLAGSLLPRVRAGSIPASVVSVST
ncbi:MAG: hypothetical protein WCB19_09830 [Thermoplasmata archaeon]